MFGQNRFANINTLLNDRFVKKKALVAVHRGAWGGNIVENTIPSYLLALEMGADMFECDLSASTDGDIFAFHDGGEKRKLGLEQNIKTLSTKEIDALTYKNSIGENSCVHVERFENIVQYFDKDELYNIDRAWDILPQTTAILKKYPHSIKHALIKTYPVEENLKFLNGCPEKYMYMPIVRSMTDVETVLSYPDINLVGMEVIAVTPQDELFQDESIKYIKSKNLFIWANVITLGGLPNHILFGGLDDDMALLKSRDEAWGAAIKKGADILQTDWPVQLSKYRDAYFSL